MLKETCAEQLIEVDELLARQADSLPLSMVTVAVAVTLCKQTLNQDQLALFSQIKSYCEKNARENSFGMVSEEVCTLDGVRYLLSTNTAKAPWTN